MKTLLIDYFIFEHPPDPWVVNTVWTLAFLATVIILGRVKRKKKLQLSEMRVDNVETVAFGIAVQINRCTDDKSLNKAVGAIGKYEWDFEGNPVAEQEAKDLKELLAKKADEIYGVEIIVS